MSVLDAYWAKSPRPGEAAGERLTTHLELTFQGAGDLAQRIGRLDCLDDQLRETFWQLVELAALTHDAGKVAAGFQDMVQGRVRAWGQRHEVLSLGFLPHLMPDPTLRAWVALAVATHHRPVLGRADGMGKVSLFGQYGELSPAELAELLGEVDPGAVHQLLEWMTQTAGLPPLSAAGLPPLSAASNAAQAVLSAAHSELNDVLARWSQLVPAGTGLSAVLLQGAVTLADHLSSAHGQLHPDQPLDAQFRTRVESDLTAPGRSIRAHQRRATEVDGHLVLRAPTGSGKTEAGLLWAVGQLAHIAGRSGGVPRLFYTLPYLASINAMVGRFDAMLGRADRVGVAHSRAGSYHLTTAIHSDDDLDAARSTPEVTAAARKALSRSAATRLFRETVRVGTPYQLLRGALAGPVHAGVLLDSANSVFLLDELHAYDAKRLGFILSMMGMWENLGGRIGVLSATMPDVLVDLVRAALRGEVRLVEGTRDNGGARHLIRLREHHLTDEQTVKEVQEELRARRSVLVVANNVAHAQQLFAALAPTAEELHGEQGAHLLHARFTRRDRSRIEKAILDRFRANAPARVGGLLVATQTVEVSLDLDCDVLHTSAGPLEALLQRFGRVNRLRHRPASDVVIHQPAYGSRQAEPGEFADGVYPAEPTRHAWQILTRHHGQPVDEPDAVGWLNEIYTSDWGLRWRAEVERQKLRFTKDFLTFRRPFEDRGDVEESFDELFDGTEAVLADDLAQYDEALQTASGAAGRLLADDWLIPMPHYARPHFDRTRRVCIIDAEYDARTGLGALRRKADAPRYHPGEII